MQDIGFIQLSIKEEITVTQPLIVCVDVDYREDGAVAAGIWFQGWKAELSCNQSVAIIRDVAEYEPGAFYRRELPCLLRVLERGPQPDIVIIDGYVWLENGKPGLGAHLHQAIGSPVVGVAKTRYVSATDILEIHRGDSLSPLFISAAGMSLPEVAEHVKEMSGTYRVPTLLKQVDSIARTFPLE